MFINLENIPVPDLENWVTKCIRWPISLNPVILGLLQAISYPDIWAGTDAEKSTMSKVIQTLMVDLMIQKECTPSGDGDTPGVEYPVIGFESLYGEGCNEMGGCSIPYNSLRWNSEGMLEYLYCGEWYVVEGHQGSGTPGGGELILPPDLDTEQNPITTCGMAMAVSQLMYNVAESIWDNKTLNAWETTVLVKADFPGMVFDDINLYNAVFAALMLDGGIWVATYGFLDYDQGDVFPVGLVNNYACRMVGEIELSTNPVQEDIMEAAKLAVNSLWPAGDPFTRNFWTYVRQAIGQRNLANAAKGGIFDTESECDCYEEAPPLDIIGPTASGWYLSEKYEYTVGCPGGFNYGFGNLYEVMQHNVYGVYFTYERISGFPLNRLKRSNDAQIPAYNVYLFATNSDSHGQNIEYCQVGDAAYAELSPLLTTPQQAKLSTKQSDIIGTPVASASQIVEACLAAQAQGGDNDYVVVKFTMRLLHNTNDGTH